MDERAVRGEECGPDCPLSAWTFRATWPIEDQELRAREAIDLAVGELPALAEEAGVRLLGEPRWSVDEVQDPSEWPYTEVAVVAHAPAVPARPGREQWPAIVAHLAAHRWSHQRIAALLDVPPRTITHLHRELLPACTAAPLHRPAAAVA